MGINPIYLAKPLISVPSYSRSNYNIQGVNNYIQTLLSQIYAFSGANSYSRTAIVANSAYIGAVYSPTQNRIYFVPYSQGTAFIGPAPGNLTENWHYIDCNTGTVGTYLNPNISVSSAYWGGVYSPTQNRIYFAPYNQGAAFPGNPNTQFWQYIDCNTGVVGTYLNPNNAISGAYRGGVYSPTENRIYFVPAAQAAPYPANPNTQYWHYIDCNTGTVGTYLNPNNSVSFGYRGGVYSPTQNRIYFVPGTQADRIYTVWHYIDCNTGLLGTYPNPGNCVSGAYDGGVFSPLQNRIYFIPRSQAAPYPANPNTQYWHYIDCSATGSTVIIGTYLNPNNVVDIGYSYGVYSPTENRVYFIPRSQAAPYPANPNTQYWHYIDCNTGTVGTYLNPNNSVNDGYIGAAYSPTENRIYFVPFAASSTWHYLDSQSNANVSKILMAGAEYNKM